MGYSNNHELHVSLPGILEDNCKYYQVQSDPLVDSIAEPLYQRKEKLLTARPDVNHVVPFSVTIATAASDLISCPKVHVDRASIARVSGRQS